MDISRQQLKHLASLAAAHQSDGERLAELRVDVVLRLLRGEQLAHLAEQLDLPAETLLAWRDAFLAGGRERLEALPTDVDFDAVPRQAKRRLHRTRTRAIAGITVGLILVALIVLATRPANIREGWITVHDGYGRVGVETSEEGEQVHFLSPTVADRSNDTHAALVASTQSYGDVDYTLRMRTIEQARQGSAPNPWETGWVVWHYEDDQHFYYLILKPNGWELGKRHPDAAGGQRFLRSDTVPVFYFDEWYDVRVVQVGPRIAIWVNDRLLTTYTDRDDPYTSGRVAMYVEDAYAQFAGVAVTEATEQTLAQERL